MYYVQFTEEVQFSFREATATAINTYCETNNCPIVQPEDRTKLVYTVNQCVCIRVQLQESVVDTMIYCPIFSGG